MPQIDLSDALTDAEILDSFTVIRRGGGDVNNFGEVQIAPIKYFNVKGVLTAATSHLDIVTDQQSLTNHINIVTKFRLQGPSPQHQPDVVYWPRANTTGDFYKVIAVNDYSRYGQGFIEAELASMDPIDGAPMPEDQR